MAQIPAYERLRAACWHLSSGGQLRPADAVVGRLYAAKPAAEWSARAARTVADMLARYALELGRAQLWPLPELDSAGIPKPLPPPRKSAAERRQEKEDRALRSYRASGEEIAGAWGRPEDSDSLPFDKRKAAGRPVYVWPADQQQREDEFFAAMDATLPEGMR